MEQESRLWHLGKQDEGGGSFPLWRVVLVDEEESKFSSKSGRNEPGGKCLESDSREISAVLYSVGH